MVLERKTIGIEKPLLIHPEPAFFIGHLLDGVAEGGSGHCLDVLAEKGTKEVHGDALTHLAKHPTHGLVHQIMWVMQVHLRIAQAP